MNTDPEKLGHLVNHIIPCLDPNLKTSEYADQFIMKTRYIEDPENIRLETSYVSIDILGEYFPHCYEFYPSDEIMMKLIQRMS